jgi:hypothetical protein
MIEKQYNRNDILIRFDGLEVKILAVINEFLLDDDQQLYAISRGKFQHDPASRFLEFDKILTQYDLENLEFTKQ